MTERKAKANAPLIKTGLEWDRKKSKGQDLRRNDSVA
jgi:hypothetical protein